MLCSVITPPRLQPISITAANATGVPPRRSPADPNPSSPRLGPDRPNRRHWISPFRCRRFSHTSALAPMASVVPPCPKYGRGVDSRKTRMTESEWQFREPPSHRMTLWRTQHVATLASKALWSRDINHPLGSPLKPLPFNGDLAAAIEHHRANGRTTRPKTKDIDSE